MKNIEIKQEKMILHGLHPFNEFKYVSYYKNIIFLNDNVKDIKTKEYYYEYEMANKEIVRKILYVIEFEFIGDELPIEIYYKDKEEFEKKWNEIKGKLK